MILFLDFDGVLHPWCSPRSEYFCYLPRLEAVLRDYSQVEIVICSDWRLSFSLSQQRRHFSDDIARRVVGQTQCLDDGSLNQDGLRRREALAYLERTGSPNRSWCALDDRMDLWYPEEPRIIHCPDQFDEREEKLLRRIIQEAFTEANSNTDDKSISSNDGNNT
jgi:hypothetical protein